MVCTCILMIRSVVHACESNVCLSCARTHARTHTVNNVMAHRREALKLIDFEYAGLNHIGLDISNSFANIPFVIFLKLGTAYDAFNDFPCQDQVKHWLLHYLCHSSALAGDGDAWMIEMQRLHVSDPKWDEAVRALKRFLPLAQLQWIPWGICSNTSTLV